LIAQSTILFIFGYAYLCRGTRRGGS
jgi:hypothetical protein